MLRKNSILNRPRPLQYKIEQLGGKVKARVKENKVFLDIKDLSKPLMIPIVFSHFPHAEIKRETKNKITIRIV